MWLAKLGQEKANESVCDNYTYMIRIPHLRCLAIFCLVLGICDRDQRVLLVANFPSGGRGRRRYVAIPYDCPSMDGSSQRRAPKTLNLERITPNDPITCNGQPERFSVEHLR